jgi:endonuclease-3
MQTKTKVRALLERLAALHPDASCALLRRNPFELLCATVLSAQTTDVAVNRVTPGLFERYPTAEAMAAASPEQIEPWIASLGMYRQKARFLVGLSAMLLREHEGQVPASLEALVRLPGVGRKTANVVLGVAFGRPEGVVVDTHVLRLAQRLGWSRFDTPDRVERDLCRLLPREDWDCVAHVLIFHGRRVCSAQRPGCDVCGVSDACPSAFQAVHVGRRGRR